MFEARRRLRIGGTFSTHSEGLELMGAYVDAYQDGSPRRSGFECDFCGGTQKKHASLMAISIARFGRGRFVSRPVVELLACARCQASLERALGALLRALEPLKGDDS